MNELHDAWVRELYDWWELYNHDFAESVLRRPQIVLFDSERRLGEWNKERRTLGISIDHIRSASWFEVLETLRHEMAHQFVDERIGGAHQPHGSEFQAACERFRVDSRATSRPAERDPNADTPRVRLLRRVEKLLSLSGSPNEHEASAAFRKAQRLIVDHNLALRETNRDFAVRELGTVRSRHHAWEFVLANILDRYFFVDVIWAHGFDARAARRGTALRAFGTEANLEMAAYIHTYLTNVLPQLWEAHKQSRGITSNRERLRYFHGVVLGFEQKLAAAQRAMRDEEGLVVQGDPELRAFFRHHNPRVQTVRRGSSRDHDAVRAGESAGRDLKIRKPIGRSDGFGGLLRG